MYFSEIKKQKLLRFLEKLQTELVEFYNFSYELILFTWIHTLTMPLSYLLSFTRKYPFRGYILGVLTHTIAWDRHWRGDETLKLVLVYVA